MQVKHTLQKTLKDGDVLRNYEVIFIGSYIYIYMILDLQENIHAKVKKAYRVSPGFADRHVVRSGHLDLDVVLEVKKKM